MKIESILNAQEITELAKERFKEERATDHLEGWFLAKEIMRECDEKFKEDVDSIRISKTLVEIAKRIPLWLSDYHIFAGTQDDVNQMAKELKAAQEALNEKDQTPQVNKDTLKEAIGKAEALDLTQYKEEGKAEFNAALQNAKAVLEKADADQDEIDQATLALNTAIQNLKPVDGGSGDGNGEGNGNGSTGGNGNGSGSTGGSGNGSGNAGGNGSTGGSGTGNSAVQTGDSSNLFVYAGTLLLAAAAFVFGFRRRNQEK